MWKNLFLTTHTPPIDFEPKKLLFAEYATLTEENKQAVRIMLSQSEKLHTAWDLKESFNDFRKTTSKGDAEKELLCWILQAEESGLSEYKNATTAFHRWSRSIINSIVCGYSNGFTE